MRLSDTFFRAVQYVSALSLPLLVLISGVMAQKPASRPASRPNVLLVTIDTLRPDYLHCYGYAQIETPSIDSLAAQGIRFEQAYTPVPITLPSHTVMLTGTYPMMSGMHDFSGNNLNSEQATLATVLRARGYDTGAVIAAAVLDRRFGLNRGFDFYYDNFNFGRLSEANLDLMERPANEVVDQALKWLAKPRNAPFFLWVHLYDPHHPYNPPPPFNRLYKENLYAGEIAFADTQLGRLLAYLKQHAAYNHTLVVLSGDHGEGLGEHGEKTHGFFTYNSTLHVPLIIKPSVNSKFINPLIKRGVSLVDLMPTVLGLLNIPIPPKVQGKNLAMMLLRGDEMEPSPLYSETYLPRIHFNWSELRGLSAKNYHFIDAPKPELYDISSDPGEIHNLYVDKNAVSSEMRSQLTATVRHYTADHEMAQKSTLDPQLADRLRALGYAAFSAGEESAVSDRQLPDPKDRIQVYELFSDAMSESQHGQYEQSAEKLNAVLKIEPDSVPAHYILGLNYYRMHQFPFAIEHLQRTLKLSPDYALAAFNLGLAYARNGDLDNAVQSLKRALELDPTNFDADYNLGAAYLQKKMVPEALAAFRQAVAIAPDFAPAHRATGEVLLFQGQVDDAVTELRRAAELQPQDPSVHASLAQALAAKGMNQEAAEEMNRAQQVQQQP